MVLLLALACVTLTAPPPTLHATLGRTHGMQMCRRWATTLDLTDQQRMSPVVRARLALEHPSAFLIVALHDGLLGAFVCTPVGPDVHRIDASVFAPEVDHVEWFRELQKWHGDNYAEQTLTVGDLEEGELQAWEQTLH